MPFSVRFVIIDVKYVSTLERRQEVIALNKSPTGASDLPLSLKSEIISYPLLSLPPANVFI